jgi:hypothetical protein
MTTKTKKSVAAPTEPTEPEEEVGAEAERSLSTRTDKSRTHREPRPSFVRMDNTMVHCGRVSFVKTQVTHIETDEQGSMTLYFTSGLSHKLSAAESVQCRAFLGMSPAKVG